MVTKSPVWQQIAEDLDLPRKGHLGGLHKGKRRGLDIAVEEQSEAKGDLVAADVDKRDTVALIKREIGDKRVAGLLIEQVEEGKMSHEKAVETIRVYLEQQQDEQEDKRHRSR